MDKAPIVLFVYNRADHTEATLDALEKNQHANESDLFIYSDAPKRKEDIAQVAAVREVIKKYTGFKKITVIEREKNYGLAKSIIEGVSEVVWQYGRAIILEDDIITSKSFLRFMNRSLEKYQNNKKVWHISGWSYPLDHLSNDGVYFGKVMNCWGWATWSDKWDQFKKSPKDLVNSLSNEEITKFDIGNSAGFWSQVLKNKNGKIDTWAVFWYACIFENEGLCLNPKTSFVENIGFDGSGVNCKKNKAYRRKVLNEDGDIYLPDLVLKDNEVEAKIKSYMLLSNKRKLAKLYNDILCSLGSKKRV